MVKYEIMAIIDNGLSEADAQSFIKETILGKITEHGGKVTFEDFWGARGFAYKIQKKTWGYYFVAQFDMEPVATLDMRKEFNIEKNLVRFLISKVDKKAPAPKTYAEMQAEYEKVDKEKAIAAAESTAEKDKKFEARKSAPKKDAVDKKLDEAVKSASASL